MDIISIHAPREGCDLDSVPWALRPGRFQSTHPARGATAATLAQKHKMLLFQSTHPARGATFGVMTLKESGKISIHAPREGCDFIRK